MDLLGRTLDEKYSVRRLIGRGGMGAVYEAEHVGTGRTVAIKTILPSIMTGGEAVERFRREARAAGRLRHPNIVDVTDFGVDRQDGGDVAYLVMEFLRGTTLRDLLRTRGILPVDIVIEIVEQIALALEVAHESGVVHRDLKPDNVWLVPDPRGGYSVRVLDFGIAKLRDAGSAVGSPLMPVAPAFSDGDEASATIARFDAQPTIARYDTSETPARADTPTLRLSDTTPYADSGTDSAPLTVAGATLGTPAYMSPEQCAGAPLDRRSDIYSLGVLAYEALCGHVPFTGKLFDILQGHLHAEPERLDRVANVSSRVADVIARSLAKRPEDRYPSARAMAGSLYAAAEGSRVILQRAASIYLERFGTFFGLSLRVAMPGLGFLALLVIASIAVPRAAPPLLLLGGVAAWTFITMMTNTTFAVVIDQLRRRPLEPLRADNVFAELRSRLGVPADASMLRIAKTLAVRYTGAEMKAKAGAGDLAFLISFLEGIPREEIPPRCAVLAASAKQSYRWIVAFIFTMQLVPPLIQACVVYVLAVLLTSINAVDFALIAAAALIPVNAVFINPISSTALALQYFRSRQANGEDVALSSVVAGRL